MVYENGEFSFYFAIMNQKEAFALAKKYKLSLLKAKIPFVSVFVFGSAARNQMHMHSDIDIAVVGNSYKGDRFKEMTEIRMLRHPISYKLQPIWFYPEHLEDRYSTLAQEIKRDGIMV